MHPDQLLSSVAEPLPPPPPERHRRTRLRRALRWIGGVLAVLILVAGGIAYWALDRYVIDHVVISDVAAYEAAVNSGAETITVEVDSEADTQAETRLDTAEPQIDISTVVTGSGDDQVTYYVADVVLGDVTQLRAGFAENKFGTNIVADTSDIAAEYDALFAVNGDYYGFRDSGIVIRNGVLFRDDPARIGLAIYRDGTMAVYDETTTTGAQLVADGVWQTLSFGPALLIDGRIVEGIEDVEVDTNFGNHSIQGNQPRTAIGMIEPNHFVFVVVDGRSRGYSRGVTMTELAQIFQDLGATVAYNLDGGGSATMVYGGDLVNDPLGKGNERGTSDILYLA
ncbi:MAG: phosphodiester glycosidase family protein [Acidimicrobiales bacterium]|nr:phosphodiester glycosidase family protein [Acidimicrobiales bacterium]